MVFYNDVDNNDSSSTPFATCALEGYAEPIVQETKQLEHILASPVRTTTTHYPF